ncbi:uncharacterized protein [Littorina saxatilis]|uniref:GBD/FH3 domain-containing protein n=1 Tax=Littorina saxatilis TaxID=31220 RepID=A0AAN9BV03_9CAEN
MRQNPDHHLMQNSDLSMGSIDDKWRILYNEHPRAPIYSVSHYIHYLRRFVADTSPATNTGGSQPGSSKDKKEKNRKESPAERKETSSDGIDPLSYFLRKLKLDLKVSYDSFVRDFVRPQNNGLSLLLRLLTNLQSSASGQHNKSSSSLNQSTSRLEDYKKSVTDEHDCLLCIKFCLRVQSAVSQLVQDVDDLQRIASGVQGFNSKARIICLDILTLCLLDHRGVDSVVEAFTVLRLQTGESVRFKMLISMLHTKSPSQVTFQVTCLKLFNTLLNACHTANQRVYLQHELLLAGLDLNFLQQCAEGDGLEYDDLKREIHEWKTRFIDVDALLKRLKGGHKDPHGGFFSDHEGPLQVSSRKGSVRSNHGMTFFQPEELAGNVHLGSQFKRDFVRSNPHLASSQLHAHDSAAYDAGWNPITYNGTLGHHDSRHVNGVDNHDNHDDNDSVLLSVSAQETPRIRRKYSSTTNVQRPVQGNTAGTRSQQQQQQQQRGSHAIQTPASSAAATHDAHKGVSRSVQDLSRPPPPYQRHGYGNHYHPAYPEKRNAARHSTTLERQTSQESIVDAYGLVIHRRDRQDDLGQGQGHEENPDGVYSNWKLKYYSTHDLPETVEESERKSPVQGKNGDEDQGHLNGKRGLKDGYDSGVYVERQYPADTQSEVWNSYYPFSKRALYRGHEHGADSTLPVRNMDSPLTGDDNEHNVKVGQHKAHTARTPDPDYTPAVTPHGSVRSLNTEVAKVLRDFENTLRDHENPVQSASSSSALTQAGPVAFV